jgi:hypothetical protein
MPPNKRLTKLKKPGIIAAISLLLLLSYSLLIAIPTAIIIWLIRALS